MRPWAGSIFAPTDYQPSKSIIPKENLELVRAYGYRSRNCRSNIRLIDGNRIVFHTAALGVVQEVREGGVQQFFRGHGGADITDLTVDGDGKYAATGDSVTNYNEKDSGVSVLIWDLNSSEVCCKLELPREMRGVAAISFTSPNSKYLIVACTDNNHTVRYLPKHRLLFMIGGRVRSQ